MAVPEINIKILSHLDALNEAHLAKKPLCFSKGLPFYTCIDAAKKIYTKELSDGKSFRVTRHLDVEKDIIIDTIV